MLCFTYPLFLIVDSIVDVVVFVAVPTVVIIVVVVAAVVGAPLAPDIFRIKTETYLST